MTEYWKSTPRKFCDFCKCWTADNRPSIDFHEKGKKHKENVKIRLEEISKKGKEDYNNQQKKDDYMLQMEAAAMKAYKKDIEDNPDMTGIKLTEMATASNSKIVVNVPASPKKRNKKPKTTVYKWREAKADNGTSYYWNIDTNESVWEAPAEGFCSLKVRKSKEKKSSEENPDVTYGPVPRAEGYSSWKTIVKEDPVDFQLPELPEETYTTPMVVISKPKIEFKEKIVKLETSSGSSTINFKKRSRDQDHKRNVRTRPDNL